MQNANGKSDTGAAAPDERTALAAVVRLLDRAASSTSVQISDGQEVAGLPATVVPAFRRLAHHLAMGRRVAVVAMQRELRTQEAADLIGVSRPHFVKLLEENVIPFTLTGKQRRVRVEDVLAFKQRHESKRRGERDRLVRLSEDLGLYDDA